MNEGNVFDKVQYELGHHVEPDPPHSLSTAERWTCKDCGMAVLHRAGVWWGQATQTPCTGVRKPSGRQRPVEP